MFTCTLKRKGDRSIKELVCKKTCIVHVFKVCSHIRIKISAYTRKRLHGIASYPITYIQKMLSPQTIVIRVQVKPLALLLVQNLGKGHPHI